MPKAPRTTETYNVLSSREGGMTVADALNAAHFAKVDRAVACASPLVGHFAVRVTATPSAHRRLSKALFN